jgi:CBS-domain-containing membrane protein
MATAKKPRVTAQGRRAPAPPPPPEPQTLPIVRRHLVGPAEPQTTLDVFCPSQEATVPADRCAECGFMKMFPRHPGAPGATLECTPPDTQASLEARKSPRIDMAESAARTPLGELVRREMACVTSDTSIEKVVSLMNEQLLEGVPVVDAAWRPIGLVTKTDLLMNSGSDGTAADIMTPFVHTLPENARLSHAVSLMAAEGVHHVPIVTSEGAVVGIVSSLDCVRWMAKEMGY